MKRLITLFFFAFLAITSHGQVQPNLPQGTQPFGQQLWRAPDGDIWTGNNFEGYTNLGNWERVADSLGAKINWSDTTLIATKPWVNAQLANIPTPDYPVESVTGTLVDNTDPKNPVINTPSAADVGALAPGDNVSELNNDAGYLQAETDPVYSGDPAAGITSGDISTWNTALQPGDNNSELTNDAGYITGSEADGAYIPLTQKAAANGVATLGADGKLPGGQLPAIAITETFVVGSRSAMLALSAETGDVAVRNDVDSSFILQSEPPSVADNWIFLKSPSVANTDQIPEGSTNLYFTEGRARASLSAGEGIEYNSGTGVITADLDGRYYTKTNLQTSGQSQVHWGNVTNAPGTLGGYGIYDAVSNDALNSTVFSISRTVDADIPNSTHIGYISGASTNIPEGFGGGIRFMGVTSNGHAFEMIGSVAGEDQLFYKKFLNGVPGVRYYQVASREYVNSLPGLAPQTLSLGVGSGSISISGGNSVRLASLVHSGNPPTDWLEYLPGQGFFPFLNTTGSTNFPAPAGYGFLMQRVNEGTDGAFALWKNSANDGKLMFNVGTTGTSWNGWEAFASEEHVANNYFHRSGGTISGKLISTAGEEAIRLNGAPTTGNAYIGIYEESGRKGYMGFAATVDDLTIVNESPATDTRLSLLSSGGSDGLIYNYGSGNKKVWHEGNFNPSGYLPLYGGTLTSGNTQVLSIESTNTSGGGNIAFKNSTTNPAGWNVGITGSIDGNFFIYNRSIPGTALIVDKNNNDVNIYGRLTLPANKGFFVGTNEVWHAGNFTPGDYLPTTSPAGSITQGDIDSWNEAAQYSAPETIIPTTVNFTINWQTDIAPGSSETYAQLHGNHFVYSAFYDNGSGETNYSPAVKINRDVNGDITTVQFADIQSGDIIIK